LDGGKVGAGDLGFWVAFGEFDGPGIEELLDVSRGKGGETVAEIK